jgi:YD repeat-containing protein
VFGDHGSAEFKLELTGDYRKWIYCVQYRETDFNFVSRLLEQEGIGYYFPGLLLEQETPLGNLSRYEYDAHGQLVTHSSPRAATTRTEFDAVGNAVRMTDANGHATVCTHDILGNLISRHDPSDRRWTYRHDAKSRFISATMRSGATVRYAYVARTMSLPM